MEENHVKLVEQYSHQSKLSQHVFALWQQSYYQLHNNCLVPHTTLEAVNTICRSLSKLATEKVQSPLNWQAIAQAASTMLLVLENNHTNKEQQ